MRRYRLTVWLDAVGGPTEAALAYFHDDVKQTERVWFPGPFDRPQEVLAEALRMVDEQLRLW